MKYLFVLILGLVVVFSGCSKERQNTEISKEQRQLLSFVPSDAQFLMYMNISDLKNSAYWDDYLSSTVNDYKENFWISDFTGNNKEEIEKFIGDFLLARLDTERSVKIYKFINGKKELNAYLNNEKYFSKNYSGTRVFYESRKKPGSYFILEDPSLLITFNWDKGLAEYLERNFNSILENDKFIGIVEQIRNRDKYWMATDRGSFASEMMRKMFASNGYKQVVKVLSSVNSITFAADFTNEVDVESIWECNDPASSGLIAAAARSAIAMDLFSDKEYALGKIMDKVSVETDVSDVVFKVDLNQNDIKELKKIAEKRNLDQKL